MDKLITIDGLSSSGKSTLSCSLAKKLGWQWISTGVIYRGIAYVGNTHHFTDKKYEEFMDSSSWHIKLAEDKTLFFYNGDDITSELYSSQVDEWASVLSAKADLRKKLISFQQSFFVKYPEGLIAEGRDCGTVIFKKAPFKIFLQADKETRSVRRSQDREQFPKQVLEDQRMRDERDEKRAFAPALRPSGSLLIDTKKWDFKEMLDYVYSEVCKKGLNKG